MTPDNLLSVIIVTYNSSDFISQCLQSIAKNKVSFEFETLVVDNFSRDQTVSEIIHGFPWVNLILNDWNVGYSQANNLGILHASSPYLLFLNPDTVLPCNALEELVNWIIQNPGFGVVGPMLTKSNGNFDKACRRSFPTPDVAFYRIFGLSRLFPTSARFARYNLEYLDENIGCEVDSVAGACMLVRRLAVDQTGGFDSDFFLYGEDIDLCLRLKKIGWHVQYYPNVRVLHYKGASSSTNFIRSRFEFFKSMGLFYKKHYKNDFSFLINAAIYFAISLLMFLEIPKILMRLDLAPIKWTQKMSRSSRLGRTGVGSWTKRKQGSTQKSSN